MAVALKPRSEAELAEAIAGASGPFELMGRGSKRGWGRTVQAESTLDLSGFDAVHDYEPEELILEAGAGTKLAELEKLIDRRGQQFAFEPPDFSTLFGGHSSGSIGGALCCNLAGPRRIKSGAARDHILGVRGVAGRGETFKAGAKVVKNVTGYDLPKLMAHSFGTLAALTAVTFKVLPKPESEETVVIEGLDPAAAVATMSAAMQSSCEVAGAAYLPGEGTYLRLEGIPASVTARRDALARLLKRPVQILAAQGSAAKWRSIRDVLPLADTSDRAVWRISMTPSEAPAFIASLRGKIDLRYYLDWAGGLVWLDVPSTDDASAGPIRAALPSGHATLIRAPEAVRAAVDVFQPQAPALAALALRMKDSFDPRHLFNPGRMYRGI